MRFVFKNEAWVFICWMIIQLAHQIAAVALMLVVNAIIVKFSFIGAVLMMIACGMVPACISGWWLVCQVKNPEVDTPAVLDDNVESESI